MSVRWTWGGVELGGRREVGFRVILRCSFLNMYLTSLSFDCIATKCHCVGSFYGLSGGVI
jgi:hypothetical protein